MSAAAVLVRAALLRAALFALLWWALVGGRPGSFMVGAASVGLATALSLFLSPPAPRAVSPLGLLRFLAFFLHRSLVGGAQVAWLALRPRMGLRPGLREIELLLPEGIGRVLLAQTLNLLPGTLSVELDAGRLRLHVLDEAAPVETEVREAEVRIAHLLGLKRQAAWAD